MAANTFEITFLLPHHQVKKKKKSSSLLAPDRKKISEKDSNWPRLDYVFISEPITVVRSDKHCDWSILCPPLWPEVESVTIKDGVAVKGYENAKHDTNLKN